MDGGGDGERDGIEEKDWDLYFGNIEFAIYDVETRCIVVFGIKLGV